MIHKLLSWTKSLNDHPRKFQLELAIHPLLNGKIIINYPGVDGSIDGYNNKYKTLAEHIVSQKLASVVRLPNPFTPGLGWSMNLRKVLEYVLKNSKEICGDTKPEIYLMGLSAGAGAIATLAWEYPQITKVLLLEPALITYEEVTQKMLGNYKGEVYIVVGSGGDALGKVFGEIFLEGSVKASRKEFYIIPNCDHSFKGEINGRIFSQAPFYAFSDDPKPVFPDKRGGIKLYD